MTDTSWSGARNGRATWLRNKILKVAAQDRGVPPLAVTLTAAVIDGLLSGMPHALTYGLGALFGLGVGLAWRTR
jgi:hypothetical protein